MKVRVSGSTFLITEHHLRKDLDLEESYKRNPAG